MSDKIEKWDSVNVSKNQATFMKYIHQLYLTNCNVKKTKTKNLLIIVIDISIILLLILGLFCSSIVMMLILQIIVNSILTDLPHYLKLSQA